MRKVSKFARGSSTYNCRYCGKLTRETGLGESDIRACAYCYEEGDLENSLANDNITQAEFDEKIAALKAHYNHD
jgi:hypothetical protein